MADDPGGQHAAAAAAGDEEVVGIDDAAFDSAAKKAGLDWDQEIIQVLRPVEQPSKYLMYLPAFALLALVYLLQRRRLAAVAKPLPQAA